MQSIIDQLEELKESLSELRDEEEEYRDNIPENLLGSARYEAAEEACDNLDSAVDDLESVIDSIGAGRQEQERPSDARERRGGGWKSQSHYRLHGK